MYPQRLRAGCLPSGEASELHNSGNIGGGNGAVAHLYGVLNQRQCEGHCTVAVVIHIGHFNFKKAVGDGLRIAVRRQNIAHSPFNLKKIGLVVPKSVIGVECNGFYVAQGVHFALVLMPQTTKGPFRVLLSAVFFVSIYSLFCLIFITSVTFDVTPNTPMILPSASKSGYFDVLMNTDEPSARPTS